MTINILMPHPPRSCSPNGGHGHWLPAWRAKKMIRKLACSKMRAALAERGRTHATFKPIGYSIVWFFYGTVQPDHDNVVARCKAILDGCADALRMDDRNLRLREVRCIHALAEYEKKHVGIYFDDGRVEEAQEGEKDHG